MSLLYSFKSSKLSSLSDTKVDNLIKFLYPSLFLAIKIYLLSLFFISIPIKGLIPLFLQDK